MFNLMPYVYRREVNPFRELEKMERELFSATRSFGFKTDITDKGDSYLLEAELPGFNKEDIRVNIEDGRMTIIAERSESKEDKNENGEIVHRERYSGKFMRSFDVSEVKEDEITASYKDGILELSMPKRQEESPKVRTLEIN